MQKLQVADASNKIRTKFEKITSLGKLFADLINNLLKIIRGYKSLENAPIFQQTKGGGKQ